MNPVIDGILNIEGSYVNHPADRGGPTKWGITEKTARAHGYKRDMRDMSREEAYRILEQDYWIAPGFDRVAQYSLPVAFELSEAGTNIRAFYPSPLVAALAECFQRPAEYSPGLNRGRRYRQKYVECAESVPG